MRLRLVDSDDILQVRPTQIVGMVVRDLQDLSFLHGRKSPEIITSPNRLPKPRSQMHGAAETLLEVFAGGAHSAAHPDAVAHDLEAVLPDI